MHPRSTSVVLLSASLGLALSACGSVNTINTRMDPTATTAIAKRQQVNDFIDSIWISCTEVRMVKSKSGALEAQLDIANNDFRTRRFGYRFVWVDANGSVILSQTSSWEVCAIPSGGSSMIHAVAPASEATDFRLEIRAQD